MPITSSLLLLNRKQREREGGLMREWGERFLVACVRHHEFYMASSSSSSCVLLDENEEEEPGE